MTTTTSTTLDLMVSWTQARAYRIGLQAQMGDLLRPPLHPGHLTVGHQPQVAEDEARRRLDLAVQEEQRLQQALDAALVQRPEGQRPEGLSRLCHDAGLSVDERSILILSFVASISTTLARRVLEPLDGGMYSRLDAQAAILFLDPQGPGDWLRARGYFGHGSRLVQEGLITVEWPCPTRTPADLVTAAVSLTNRAFSVIAGLPDETEDDERRL